MQLDTPTAAYRDRQSREPSAQGAIFARAVTSRRPGDTPPAATTFAALVAIGDDAVRFDARPIVAPVAEKMSATGAERLAMASGVEVGTAKASVPDGETLVEMLRTAIADACDPQRSAIMGTEMAHSLSAASVAQTGTARALVAGPTRALGNDPTKPAATPAPAPPRAAATNRHAVVRTVAFADEVRVLIRGLALTSDDRAELTRVAREMLGGTPLAGRPVRLIEIGGRG